MTARWLVAAVGAALIAVGLLLVFIPGLDASSGGTIGAGILAVCGAAIVRPQPREQRRQEDYRQHP